MLCFTFKRDVLTTLLAIYILYKARVVWDEPVQNGSGKVLFCFSQLFSDTIGCFKGILSPVQDKASS